MVIDWSVERPRFAAMIERFGKAWENGNGQALAEVFTENASFVPNPFEAPVVGRRAIAAYWHDVPYTQTEVRFRAGEVFVAGPWFCTEFRCTFRRRRTGEQVDVRGALFCETEGDLVSEMRMYYLRTSGR
jgi:ketosteroid isomerase-like protein